MKVMIQKRATPFITLMTFCFAATLAATGQGGAADIESLQLVTLPAPQFNRQFAKRPAAKKPRLQVVSTKRNQITDEETWFSANDLRLPLYRVSDAARDRLMELPPQAPTAYKGNLLVKAIRQPKTITLVYGKDYASGRFLIAMDAESGKFLYGYDFINYTRAPENDVQDLDFVFQAVEWAVEEGDTLYVSHGHLTYARSSRGMNAYITAIDTRTNRVLWRSQPLVSNSNNFEVIGNLIVSGYGFTAEPDYLYLLDKKTGDVRQQLAVKSRADYIIHKNNKIYVRTYDTDLVVNLK
ncbi:MAG TPA: hypothetical protein VFO63_19025 [Blastocatellia bacterium]|nr:hypothetical protein [Blastocatellia bacterium]